MPKAPSNGLAKVISLSLSLALPQAAPARFFEREAHCRLPAQRPNTVLGSPLVRMLFFILLI
jgi:hypothetical protein